jgi:hypothetical protein
MEQVKSGLDGSAKKIPYEVWKVMKIQENVREDANIKILPVSKIGFWHLCYFTYLRHLDFNRRCFLRGVSDNKVDSGYTKQSMQVTIFMIK